MSNIKVKSDSVFFILWQIDIILQCMETIGSIYFGLGTKSNNMMEQLMRSMFGNDNTSNTSTPSGVDPSFSELD